MAEEMTREERLKMSELRRKRRRQRLENALSARALILLCFIYLLIVLILLIVPRPKKSQIEKRDLASFPKFSVSKWFSGEFTHGITTWYDDTVPFKDPLKDANNTLKKYMGLHTANNVEMVGKVSKVDEESSKSKKSKTDNKNYIKDDAEGALDDGILIVQQDGHWRGLPLFGGNNSGKYAEFMNELRKKTDKKVKIYAMPIPLASAYYLPRNFSEYSADQRDFIEKVFDEIDDGVIPIQLIDVLGDHEEEDIYLRTDHHWSALGAFYASRALAKEAGLPYIKLKNYHRIKRPGYVGSMYGYTQSAKLKDDPEEFSIFIPKTPYVTAYHNPNYTFTQLKDLFVKTNAANSYMTFHAGDGSIVHTKTATDNGRKLLILKDSYGNPLSGFLTGTYEEIYSVDWRFCEINLPRFIKEQKITDIVVAMDLYTVANPKDGLAKLLTQNEGTAIPDDEPEEMVVPSGPGSPYYEESVDGKDPLLVNKE